MNMRVAYLVFEDSRPAGLFKVPDIFDDANKVMSKAGVDKPPFNLKVVGTSHRPFSLFNAITISPDLAIQDENEVFDLVILAPFKLMDGGAIVSKYGVSVPWLQWQYQHGAQLYSLCNSAFLLAEAGLLTNKPCTTHWMMQDEFKTRYPDTQFQPERVLAKSGRISTSGGAENIMYAILDVVFNYAGLEVTNFIANAYGVEPNRITQAYFHNFRPYTEHNDVKVMKAQEYIAEHYQDDIKAEDLAQLASLGLRQFIRRFKRALGITPGHYVQEVRIDKARGLLATTDMSVKEVMYAVGYNDPKSFRTRFINITRLTPQEYRSKYPSNYWQQLARASA